MPELFHQVYGAVGSSIFLSALVAALPPILLAVLLAGIRLALNTPLIPALRGE